MSRAFQAVCAEHWAITADWLHVIAALALRDREHPLVLNAYKDDEGRKQPTPEERFSALFHVQGAARRLEGQGSGRAVVINGVAILPILGPIFPRSNMMTAFSGATSCAEIHKDLSAALADEGVSSVLFAVDSPGGAVSGVNALADAIFAARGRKPIGAHVTGTGASAAYWLASSAERLTLERTGIVGSIGVVVAMPKQVRPDSKGDMYIEIVSTNAPNKRPDPTEPEGVAEIRQSLDALEAQFIGDVARNRGVPMQTVISDFGKGGVFVGAEAKKRKMADAVSTFEAAVAHMSRVGKASRARQAAGE